MRIGWFSIWCTKREALELGCTHKALFLGVIPGFTNNQDSNFLWVPRSDFLVPFEFVAQLLWAVYCLMTGREDFLFVIGAPIKAGDQ